MAMKFTPFCSTKKQELYNYMGIYLHSYILE